MQFDLAATSFEALVVRAASPMPAALKFFAIVAR